MERERECERAGDSINQLDITGGKQSKRARVNARVRKIPSINHSINQFKRVPAAWRTLMAWRWPLPVLLAVGFALSFAIPRFNLVNAYAQFVLMLIGIYIILTISLNLINGYMGEFSVGHAGLMGVGAYVAALLTVRVFPASLGAWLFPLAVAAGGLASACVGLLIAIPSFKTRGDYLAIVTLAFNMIIKSAIENIDAIGGPRGLMGMDRLTNLPWTFAWTVAALWMIRNFIYSKYGRGVLTIREDEIAGELMSVNTRRVKILAFALSSFFAGVAGGLKMSKVSSREKAMKSR